MDNSAKNLNIFLSGGGSAEESKLLDESFSRTVSSDKSIIYIPLAMEKSRFNQCFRWIKSVFPNKKIIMWKDLKKNNFSQLKNSAAVYIGGGNTFKLLYLFTKNGFNEVLKNYIKDGGIVYGGSAGAIILGYDLSTCWGEINKTCLKNLKGLNLINGYSIWCHYRTEHDQKILEISKKQKGIIALSDKNGIQINTGWLISVGFEPVFLFKSGIKLEFKPGSNFI